MSEHLRSLGPRHHAAIRLKLDGASGSEIADALDVHTRTVYLWMADPLVKQELGRQLDRIGEEFARQLALAATVGVNELRKMAELPVEERASREYVFDASRFDDLAVPTLYLQGGDSSEPFRAAGEALRGLCRTAAW